MFLTFYFQASNETNSGILLDQFNTGGAAFLSSDVNYYQFKSAAPSPLRQDKLCM